MLTVIAGAGEAMQKDPACPGLQQSAPAARDEAVTLLKASLDPETLLTTSSMQDYEACLDTVLFHSHRLLPATVTSLLGCFHVSQYAGRLLQEQTGEAAQAEAEGGAWSREDTARVRLTLTWLLPTQQLLLLLVC